MNSLLLATIEDLVTNLMYYDRKEDEEFNLDDLEEAKKSTSPEEVAEEFLERLREAW